MATLRRKAPPIGIAMFFLLGLGVIFNWPRAALIGIVVFAAAWIASIGFSALSKVSASTKKTLVGGICKFLNLSFSVDVNIPPKIEMFRDVGLIPRHQGRSSFEDLISGEAYNAKFEFYEAHLERLELNKDRERYRTIFRGQLLALEFDQKFLGRTVVLRDSGWFNSKKKGDMKRVGLVDPVFEKIFEAYGTDQVEARYLLTPTFMQRLVDLEHSVDGHNIRFGFTGGYLLIAVETADRYEPGSMFSSLLETERTQKILDDIGAIYDVIAGVMKRPLSRSPYGGNTG